MIRPLFCIWQQDINKLTLKKRKSSVETLDLNSDKTIPVFDEATQTVANTLNVPVAILGIVNDREYCFKSAYGLSRLGLINNQLAMERKMPLAESFATHVIDSGNCLILENAFTDSFFANSDLCQIYGVQTYVGIPLISSQGVCIGCLEIMDTQSKQFTPTEINYLVLTSRWCMAEYERGYLQEKGHKITTTVTNTISNSVSKPESTPLDDMIITSTRKQEESYLKQLTFLLLNKLTSKLSIPLTSVIGMSSVL